MKNNFARKVLKKIKNKKCRYDEDAILLQERFEPKNWNMPTEKQLELIEKNYLIGTKIDYGYVKQALSKPVINGLVRVAVPKLSFLAKFNNIKDPYLDVGVLIEQACVLLIEQRQGKFTHYRKGQLGSNRIQCIKKLIERRKNIEKNIPGDILILDIDMGNIYAGWTPRRARESIICNKDQMALSSVDLCWILLLNPDRFQCNVDLSVDSVMEKYYSEDRGWVTNLFFYHRGGKLEFGYRWNRRAYFDSGSAIAIIS